MPRNKPTSKPALPSPGADLRAAQSEAIALRSERARLCREIADLRSALASEQIATQAANSRAASEQAARKHAEGVVRGTAAPSVFARAVDMLLGDACRQQHMISTIEIERAASPDIDAIGRVVARFYAPVSGSGE